MASTTFSSGTVVASSWLNDINDGVYDDVFASKAQHYSTITGDGTTDDSAGLSALFTSCVTNGWVCQLEGTKTYAIAGSNFTFPDGLRLLTNGATFKTTTTTTSNDVFMLVGDNTYIDELNVTIPTGVRRDRTIFVSGDNINIGKISLTSTDQQTTTEAGDYGVSINSCTNTRIGIIITSNIDRAVVVALNTDTWIGGLNIDECVRGAYIHGNTYLHIGKSTIHGNSPNATQTAGHNPVLLGRESADQTDITLQDFTIITAGEHGIRIGGGPQKRIYLVRPNVYGAAGNGIKILGTDNSAPVAGEYQEDIVIDNPIIEGCGTGSGSASNLCGILVERTNGININNPIIRPRGVANAHQYGIRVFACTDVMINNPLIEDTVAEGIRVDTADSGATSSGTDNVHINGGLIYDCGDDGLSLSASDSQVLSNIVTTGLRIQSNGNRGLAIATGTGGSFSACLINASTNGNTGGAIVCNSSAVTLQVKSSAAEITTTPLSGVTAANGSWYDDGTTLNYRKAGAWTAL